MTCALRGEHSIILPPVSLLSPLRGARKSHRFWPIRVRERRPCFSTRPGARSELARRKDWIFANFALEYPREQARLDLQHAPITHPILK
jgi:hypothetical protein